MAEVEEAKRAAYKQSIARLHQASSAAVTTLMKVMVDPGTPHPRRYARQTASWTILPKAIEIEDIDARVSELERAVPKESHNR